MTPDQVKGQAGVCETVKILSGESYAVINKADFDDKLHTLYEASEEKSSIDPAPGQKVARKR